MIKRSLHTAKGFTLVEVLVVTVIMGVIMGAVYSLYITNQHTSYTQDETVEVQQNLRIAMDMVSRDLRMAGMLVDYGSSVYPIQSVVNNSGPNSSDGITMNMASAVGNYARIDADNTPAGTTATFDLSPSTTAETPVTATSRITSSGDGDILQVGDKVRILRSFQNTQPTDSDAVFEVTAVQRQVGLKGISTIPATDPTTKPTVTLKDVAGTSMTGIEFKRGDIIAKVNATDATTPSPNTVQYAVVTYAAAPATATTDPNCPTNQRCLARRLNNESTATGDPIWQIVAQNITNFQLQYLLDDNSIVDNPGDRSVIKAVMVTISGETVSTRMLSDNVPKTRQLASVVKLRNRR